jgi:hypothetical protein
MALIGELFAGWTGDGNKAIGADVYALTILLRIKPGLTQRLRAELRALRDDSPFAALEGTHFARLVVIDKLAFEGPAQDAPDLRGELLLFTAVVDGDAWHDYVRKLSTERLQPVWDACVGAPRPADGPGFTSWMLANQIQTRAFFWDYDATVREVQAALALRERVRAFALANKYVTPAVLKRNFLAAFKDGAA